jgi:hypothetical protein
VIAICVLLSLLAWTGCGSGRAAIPPVDVDIEDIVRQMMSKYDTNKNGALSQSELAAFPPLEQCLVGCRRDLGDEISAQQLDKKLRVIFDPRSALVSANCVVRRNGQPLSGAEVRFVPLAVFDEVLPVATGLTDAKGVAMIAAAPEELPSAAPNVRLMPPGLYLVEISHPTMKIPAKYNEQTVLGKEVSSETVYRGGLAVDLKL